jgi:hypothetical protein
MLQSVIDVGKKLGGFEVKKICERHLNVGQLRTPNGRPVPGGPMICYDCGEGQLSLPITDEVLEYWKSQTWQFKFKRWLEGLKK